MWSTASTDLGVWLRDLDALAPHPLAGTEDAAHPFWAPDGSAIGFFVGGHLKRVPIAGGDAVTLCEARGGGGAAWSRDGVILFATSVDAGLSTVPAAGRRPGSRTPRSSPGSRPGP